MGIWGWPEGREMDGHRNKKSSKRKGGGTFRETGMSDMSGPPLSQCWRNAGLPPGGKMCRLQFFFLCRLLQADAIYNMVGYPEFIMNATKLDKVFNDVGECGTVPYTQNHTVMFLHDKVSHFAFLKHWIVFLSFSLRSCQSSTSKMSCSTTTFQPEWLQTSWGKLPTETSELLP